MSATCSSLSSWNDLIAWLRALWIEGELGDAAAAGDA